MAERNDVYVCKQVAGVQALHPYVFDPAFRALPIAEQLDRQARTLLTAHSRGDRRIKPQIESWRPGAAGQSIEAMLAAPFTLDDACLTIAREYGFKDWPAVLAMGDRAPDAQFEEAVDALIAGDLEHLRQMLNAHLGLAHARSRYGHRSTLLHYIGANGVETYRQQTPLNAVAIARLLLDYGADAGAEADMYGGGQTALGLVLTSAHPAGAGLTEPLAALLRSAVKGDR